MKKLLLILVFQFFSSQILALEDSVFYCVETQNQLMFSDSNNSKVNLEGFVLKKDGEFIELKGSIFGNKDSLNPFTKLDVVTDYQGELFARKNKNIYYQHLNKNQLYALLNPNNRIPIINSLMNLGGEYKVEKKQRKSKIQHKTLKNKKKRRNKSKTLKTSKFK